MAIEQVSVQLGRALREVVALGQPLVCELAEGDLAPLRVDRRTVVPGDLDLVGLGHCLLLGQEHPADLATCHLWRIG